MPGRGGKVYPTSAVGMHPTGMFSCWNCIGSLSILASKTFDTQRNFKCMYLRKNATLERKSW